MKRTGTLVGSSLLLAGLALPVLSDQTTPNQGLHQHDPSLVAFRNATLVTEPGTRIEEATLVIEHGKIRAIHTNNRAPEGARVIDASGYTIYPGFIDAYSNYGVAEPASAGDRSRSAAPIYTNQREGGNAANGAIHAERNWFETFAADPASAGDYVQHGFTAVQSARLDGVFQGRGTALSLAEQLPNDTIYRDKTRHFGSFDKGSSMQQYPNSLMGSIALIRQTLADADWYQEAAGLTTSEGKVEFNAALEALTELPNQGMIFHTTDEQNLLRAARVFGEFEVPVTYVGSGFEYSRLDEITEYASSIILPLNFPAAPELDEQFGELDVSLTDLRHWERAPGNPAALAGAGVDLAFTLHGMDEPEDFWTNLRTAIDHGLTREQALAGLTTVPARLAGINDQAGRLAAGYRADFVIAEGDLFTDGEIVSVWLQGQEEQLQPMHATDFAGDYSLAVGELELTLSLQGNERLQGLMTDGETEVQLHEVRHDEDSIQFVVALDDLGHSGIYRFRLSHSALNELTGTAQAADGNRQDVLAQRQEDAADETETELRTAGSPDYISQLTFPNTGFGITAQPDQQNLHIRNATVWTADDQGVLEQTDVLVRNGEIRRVGQDLSTPRGYEVIDATGMHLTPGIIDEHSHIAISQGVNEGTEAVTSETRIGDVVNPDDIHIYRSLAGGTTIAHLLHGSANPIGGQGQAIKLRWGEGAEALKFQATPPTIKMALGENVKQSNWGELYTERYPQTRMGVAALMYDYFKEARDYEAAKAAYDNLSRSERRQTAAPRTNYRLEALAEILASERFTHVHSYVASEVLALMDVADALDFTIHTFTHILEGYKVAEELADHGANASSFADWWAFKIEAYDAIPQNMCLMMDAGVLTSINSDSNDLQRRMNTEAAKSVRYCGMDQHEALQMITAYPAQQLEIDEYVGSITPGKHADFVLWDDHPLSAYAQVQQTWIEGRKYFDREQDLEQREAIAAERTALIEEVLRRGTDAQRGSRTNYRREQPTWHCETELDIWRQWDGESGLIHEHEGVH